MRVSLNWINQLVNIETVNLEHLIEKLTLGGFEVEEILEVLIDGKKEIVVDISATANRADSLSIKGIAKEISSLMNISYKNSKYLNNQLEIKNKIKEFLPISTQFENCSLFFAITVENLINFSSPYWLKQKLISVGLTPVNNLLDYQNYILIETGYPFEFYDLEKIQEKSRISEINLTLGFTNNDTNFIGNNDIEYRLNDDILVIKTNNDILSIAGIISNKDFCYTSNTHSLLIEGAIYNSQKIRKTSRKLNFRTDRSARYEKGLNSTHFVESFYRLISLLKISNPNLICKLHTIYQQNDKIFPPIKLRYENILKILGPTNFAQTNQIIPTQISDYLTRLNFEFVFNSKNSTWEVQVPNFRLDDINREVDLIEEIGRLHGFNNFITCLPKINQIGWKDFSYQIRKKLTFCFISEGLNELVHYSLVNEEKNNTISLLNPLLTDCKSLRSSLLPNIIETISENIKQTGVTIEGFEFGHVFSRDKICDYREIESVAGTFGGIAVKDNWSTSSKTLSWFEAKGKIEEIFFKLNLSIFWRNFKLPIYRTILHPYRAAELYLNNDTYIGIFGQIHPILARKLNISSQLYLFEFNFELLKIELKKNKLPLYKHYSLYPKIIKDLSFIVDRHISFEKIKNIILSNGTPYLVQVELLDEYQGKSIPPSSTSLCVQLIFQSDQKTLVTKEIEEIVDNIQLTLTKKFNVQIRV